MKTIFDETTIANLTIKNRVAAAAVGRNLADIDGHITDELYDIYQELAQGGVGLIISEMTMVSDADYLMPGFTRMQDDSVLADYKKLTDIIHQAGIFIVAQLAFGAFHKMDHNDELKQLSPDELSEADIRKIIRDFTDAAVRAKKAGFDGVELHCAHGFLLNKILSPAFNHRTDEYGGKTENRTAIAAEIIREIHGKCGEFPIIAKVNSTDNLAGGITEKESIAICELLVSAGVDAIEVSGMNATVDGIRPGEAEGYFASFAKNLKKAVTVPVVLTGGHRSKEHMERLLSEDACDMFSIARPLIREPGLIARWEKVNLKPSDCVSCNMCASMKGHRCIKGTLHADGAVTKNERA
jgi:2,4-dienoyl-CoA reductase-like NADH-dependent reductase (Old Yellow Enzyme family)